MNDESATSVSPRTAETTVVVVAYGNRSLDLSWVPRETPVVLVHNDESVTEISCGAAFLTHVRPGRNLGFGSGVNTALAHVQTPRVLLANPDTQLTPEHWALLDCGEADDVVTVPQHDDQGRPNSVVNPYPSPAALLAQAWRLGRWLPRGTRRRVLLARLLGRQGAAHIELLTPGTARETERVLPLREYWVSGSLLSLDADRLRAVGGFSDEFFLYYEDVDVCARLASRFPQMRIRLRSGAGSALHTVGASVPTAGARKVSGIRRRSARSYAGGRQGTAWSACGAVLAVTAPATSGGSRP